MKLKSIVDSKDHRVHTISPQALLQDALGHLCEERIGALPVMEAKWLKGILTERDLLYCYRRGVDPYATRVGEVMTTDLLVAVLDDDVIGCMSTMTARRIRHLPVVDGEGRLLAMISIGDLVKAMQREGEQQIHFLSAYIKGEPL